MFIIFISYYHYKMGIIYSYKIFIGDFSQLLKLILFTIGTGEMFRLSL